VWLNKGQIVEEPDVNATQMLLDLGALDSIDYFADGALKCVVATEDADKEPLRALLWSNGFVEDDTEVASYAGCAKVEAALVLGKFLRDKAPQLGFVVHRDRDFMSDDHAKEFTKTLEGTGLHAFITACSDVEGYFLSAEHLHYVNPALSVDRIRDIINQATTETRDESIKAIVNLRTAAAYRESRGTGKGPDHGTIAVEAARYYDANPAASRRGKVVLKRVIAKMQEEIKSTPKVFVSSPHLACAELKLLVAELWPEVMEIPGTPVVIKL
jgi:hypothetical protein